LDKLRVLHSKPYDQYMNKFRLMLNKLNDNEDKLKRMLPSVFNTQPTIHQDIKESINNNKITQMLSTIEMKKHKLYALLSNIYKEYSNVMLLTDKILFYNVNIFIQLDNFENEIKKLL
jgi:hypothetical protein